MALKFDEIGRWSEIKLDILEQYARPYSLILSSRKNPRFHHVYIDAFSGSGTHISKRTGKRVRGSPQIALGITPPFKEFYFIDIDGVKVNALKQIVGDRPDVHIYEGDCNEILMKYVFPKITYKDYQRGLCLLDPYGLNLDWTVMNTAGHMNTIDLILNFPVMDMNRNILWTNPEGVDPSDIVRMNRFWGDESWKEAAYQQVPTLFGGFVGKKQTNRTIALAYKKRLETFAGFKHVLRPIPMRNSRGAIIYYLFFASQQEIADKIATHIRTKYCI